MNPTHPAHVARGLRAAFAALLLVPQVSAAQEPAPPVAGAEAAAEQPAQLPLDNPWARRPSCASMFLKSDWRLTTKQIACDWLHNRVFTNSALFSAGWSAGVSKVRDSDSEAGDSFATRFGRRYGQHAFKSTAAYLAGRIVGEDPRVEPPYLVMQTGPRPRGFWKRTRHALAANFVSYKCVDTCTAPEDIRRRPAISKVAGALASGFGSEVWTWDRENSTTRALRGAATAYGSTFVDALFNEFRPEITRFTGRLFGGIFAPM